MAIFARIVLSILFLLAPLVATNSHAHRMDSAFSIIDYNPVSGKIAITHRIFAHDLEHLFNLNEIGLQYFETSEGQNLVENYLKRAFTIASPNRPVTLNFIGVEVEGDLLYVYFEADVLGAEILTIDSNILENYSASQTNFVNVHIGNVTKSLMFSNGQIPQMINLRF